jgi:hypothetical protein
MVATRRNFFPPGNCENISTIGSAIDPSVRGILSGQCTADEKVLDLQEEALAQSPASACER